MSKRTRSIFYIIWTCALFIVLVIVLFAIIFASSSKAKEPAPVTPPVETVAVSEPETAAPNGAEPGEAEPGEAEPGTAAPGEAEPGTQVTATPASTVLGLTEDAGQQYLDKFYFLGDSTTYSLIYHALIPSERVWTPASGTLTLYNWAISTVVMRPDGEELFIADAVAAKQPEYLLITLGVNGVNSLNEEDFVYYYSELINAILEKSPNTKIIINSIYPVGTSYAYLKDINNEKISAANGWLQGMAEDLGLHYLDSCSVLKDSNGNLPDDYDMDDGLHLNKSALELVLNYLRTHAYQ